MFKFILTCSKTQPHPLVNNSYSWYRYSTGISQFAIKVVNCLLVVCLSIVVNVEMSLCNGIHTSPAKVCRPISVPYKTKSYTCPYNDKRTTIAGYIATLLCMLFISRGVVVKIVSPRWQKGVRGRGEVLECMCDVGNPACSRIENF